VVSTHRTDFVVTNDLAQHSTPGDTAGAWLALERLSNCMRVDEAGDGVRRLASAAKHASAQLIILVVPSSFSTAQMPLPSKAEPDNLKHTVLLDGYLCRQLEAVSYYGFCVSPTMTNTQLSCN